MSQHVPSHRALQHGHFTSVRDAASAELTEVDQIDSINAPATAPPKPAA